MNPKPCHQCGTTFTPYSAAVKYCSGRCAKAAKTAQMRRYNAANKRKPKEAQPIRRAPRNSALRPGYDDVVLAQCWCQYTYIEIPAATIRNGRTGTCGQPHCTPPTERPTR